MVDANLKSDKSYSVIGNMISFLGGPSISFLFTENVLACRVIDGWQSMKNFGTFIYVSLIHAILSFPLSHGIILV